MRRIIPIILTAVIAAMPVNIRASSFPRLDALASGAYEAPPRYYAEHTPGFIPSGDYGTVLPYIGGADINQQWNTVNYRYGFATAEGVIVCDPVYNNVLRVTNGTDAAYFAEQNLLPNGAERDSYSLSFVTNSGQAERKCAVISEDGAFFGEFDEVFTYLADDGLVYENIPVRIGDKWGVIDFKGAWVLPCEYPFPPIFRQGLAIMYDDAGYDSFSDYVRELEPYYFIDVSGNKKLGPYEPFPDSAVIGMYPTGLDFLLDMSFQNDRAKVFDGFKYGFMNLSGEVVVPPSFVPTGAKTWNDAGLALVFRPEFDFDIFPRRYGLGVYSLIDKDGNSFLEVEAEAYGLWTWTGKDEDAYILKDKENNIASVYALDGTEIPITGDQYMGGGYFGTKINDGGRTNTIITGHGEEHIIAGEASFIDGSGSWFRIVDSASNIETGIWNAATGESRQVYSDSPAFDIFNEIGGYYLAAQGNYGGLADARGNWVIRVRLDGNYD